MSNSVHIVVSTDQAERLLALVDSENAAQKNRLVTAVLSPTEYRSQAERLAEDSVFLTHLRASVSRSIRASK